MGDDGFRIGVDIGSMGQSRESGILVELDEVEFEVSAFHEVYFFDVDVDVELRTERVGISEHVMDFQSKNTHTAISATAAQTDRSKV